MEKHQEKPNDFRLLFRSQTLIFDATLNVVLCYIYRIKFKSFEKKKESNNNEKYNNKKKKRLIQMGSDSYTMEPYRSNGPRSKLKYWKKTKNAII
ncbi:hypothetical protein BpHYR1_019548, partial [Brachionus plicatilis]